MNDAIIFSAIAAGTLGVVAWWLARPLLGRAAAQRWLIGLVLAGGGVMYLGLGEPRALEPANLRAAAGLEDLVAELAAKMDREPADPRGWIMLGKSYVALGRFADAQAAYLQARERSGDRDPTALAGWAEARVLEDPSRLATEGAAAFARVLELAPDDAKGLWYGALAAAERGDTARAEALFTQLLAQAPPAELRSAIEQRRAALGTARSFAVTVEIDATLSIPADASLFVYLRRPGYPMPLAARRLPIGTFPAQVELGARELLGATPVPDDEPLIVGARLSPSATRRRGDPFGELEVVAGHRAAVVRIDRRVP